MGREARAGMEDRAAVLQEVRLIIVEAMRDREPIRAEALARIVASSYPRSGMGSGEIAQRIKDAALAAGVPVEAGGVVWRESLTKQNAA